MPRSSWLTIGVALASLALGARSDAAVRERMVGLGDLVPGNPDARFVSLGTLSITDDGTAVILGRIRTWIDDGRYPYEYGLWKWSPGLGLARIPTPSLGQSVDPDRLAAAGNGRVVFAATDEAGVDRLFSCLVGNATADDCTTLATAGDTALGMPDGWTLHHFAGVDLDAGGALSFSATIDTPDPEAATGVFAYGDAATLVAATGDALSGAGTLAIGARNDRVTGGGGTIAFTSSVPPEPASPFDDSHEMLVRWTAERGLEGLLVGDQPAPGFDEGATFAWPTRGLYIPPLGFDVAPDGTVAFAATTQTAGAPDPGRGIWTCDPGAACELLVRDGDPLPDDAESAFAGFGDTTLSADGTLAVTATYAPVGAGSSERRIGVFTKRAGDMLRSCLRQGDRDPAGDPISGIYFIVSTGSGGRAVVNAFVEQWGASDNRAAYACDPDGGIRTVMRTGDPLDPPEPAFVSAFDVIATTADAAAEHVALNVYGPDSLGPVLIYATLPELGALAGASTALVAIGAIAAGRRRLRAL